jgi:dipeptidase E
MQGGRQTRNAGPNRVAAMDQRRIVAMGGGGFSMEPDNPRLDTFVLSLTGVERPRVCFVATASGDSERYVRDFYRAFAAHDCQATDLALFDRTVDDLEAFVLAQDVIYVGGGNTASLLAVWRAHGLDTVLRAAWERGIVLTGLSAGMNCWFEGSVTDSYCLNRLQALGDGLGLVAGSACPHFDGEAQRRPTYERLVQEGALAAGHAADDGVALVFHGTELTEVVSSRRDAAAYRVQAGESGAEVRRLETRRL